MQPRTTGILFLIALALGTFVYFYEIRGEKGREEAEESSRRIFPQVESEAIEELRLTTAEGVEIRALREEEHWRIVAPVNFPGDDVNFDAMASGLANLTWDAKVGSPRAASVYGLGADTRRHRVSAGVAGVGLFLGGSTPINEGIYLSRESQPDTILILPRWRTKPFDHDLLDLRDRRLIHFDRNEVARLRASWPGGWVGLERRDDSWWFSGPGALAGLPADGSRVNDLLSDLSFLRARGFIDGEWSADEVGLDDPYFRLELRGRTGGDLTSGMPPVSVEFGEGGRVSDGDAVARGGVPGTLYRVAASRLADLPRNSFDYRFKELARFELAEAGAFELDFRGDSDSPDEKRDDSQSSLGVRVERRGDGWAATGEQAWKPGTAARLIAELAHLEATEIVAEGMGGDELSALGLAPPKLTLRVFSREGSAGEPAEELAEVALGYFDPNRGIIAKSSASDVIYRIDAGLAAQIPVSYDAYLADFVVRAPPDPEPKEEGSE
jgi:hypothetical protein